MELAEPLSDGNGHLLPLFLAVYSAAPLRLKNGALLLFSLVFYAWGEPVYILLMLLVSFSDYLIDRVLPESGILLAEPGQLYYRTDHHWTTYGAYQGYRCFCEAAGLTPVPLSAWTAETVTEDFRGTIYSKLNDYSVPGGPIVSCTYPGDRLSVVYEDTGETKDTLYNPAYLGQKDKFYNMNTLDTDLGIGGIF